MPQLNPTPWFFIMILSWFTYSMIIQPKVMAFVSTNPPTRKEPATNTTTPWNWPWT